MKRLILFVLTIFLISCSGRNDEPINPTDGYNIMTNFGTLAGMKYATYNGQNPATKITFKSSGSGVTLILAGVDYSQNQTYSTNSGGMYLKINDTYAQIKIEQSSAYPASTVRKKFTFIGFPTGSGVYEMQETP